MDNRDELRTKIVKLRDGNPDNADVQTVTSFLLRTMELLDEQYANIQFVASFLQSVTGKDTN